MLRQLLIGGLVSVINIAVHALFMSMVISAARRTGALRANSQLGTFDDFSPD